MATYAIGDVQGCFVQLQTLLEKISFNPTQDELWMVGDLVNRGPQSLEVLRFIKNLPRVKVVLGNHDLHLVALAFGYSQQNKFLQPILDAPDAAEIINWLCHLPLLHHDEKLNYVMVHAGIYPLWDLTQAKQYAKEVENVLHSQVLPEFLLHMYGDQPDHWNEELQGWERLRFIVNAFTRMRFCTAQGHLELRIINEGENTLSGFLPWYKLPQRPAKNERIVFGHWAALQGKVNEKNLFALDTGCVWGNTLTAMRLEDQQRFEVSCKP